jgi:isopentenyldiphosphate isomerase
MEKFDIFDKNGELTGNIADKGTTLQDGQYYLGVHAYIHNSSNEFLLQQRAIDKDFLPGEWDIHLGHVMAGETSKDGIIREIGEELGLTFPYEKMRFLKRIFWHIHNHIIDVYFLNIEFKLDDLNLQENEVIGAKTVSKDEMLSMVSNMYYRPEEYREIVTNEINKLAESL